MIKFFEHKNEDKKIKFFDVFIGDEVFGSILLANIEAVQFVLRSTWNVNGEFLTASDLRLIADKLDELNTKSIPFELQSKKEEF